MNDRLLVQRAAIAVLNSIHVSKGIVAWRKPQSLGKRLLDQFSGERNRLDNVLSGHVTGALEGLHTLVEAVRDQADKSDLLLLRTISALKLIRADVESTSLEVKGLQSDLEALERRLSDELSMLWREVKFASAGVDVEIIFAKLDEQGHWHGLSAESLWRIADELWWGRFGTVLRHDPESTDALGLKTLFYAKLRQALDRYGSPGLFETEPLLSRVQVLDDPEDLERAELLTLSPTWQLRPLTSAILARQNGNPEVSEEARRLPIVTSADALGDRLLKEAERGTGS